MISVYSLTLITSQIIFLLFELNINFLIKKITGEQKEKKKSNLVHIP